MLNGKRNVENAKRKFQEQQSAEKSNLSKWTFRERTKGLLESVKMIHFTNRDYKKRWNDFHNLHDEPEHKLKLLIPVSSQKKLN